MAQADEDYVGGGVDGTGIWDRHHIIFVSLIVILLCVCMCVCVLMGDELAKCYKRQRKHTHIHIVVERKCQLMSKKTEKKKKKL